ncbi:MAG: hypothetical protein AAGJ81_05255 [Verrucomicrobiota bacterium]
MKLAFLLFSSLGLVLSVNAEIEILYLSPSESSPVLGSVSTGSELYESAVPVEGKEPWMEITRTDFFSGFIAQDSLTPEGTVEVGTSVLLTPSRTGQVLTTVGEEDEVTINLVDDWTEITIYKSVPGYFIPADAKPVPASTPPDSALGRSRITYANDPLLRRAEGTRYVAPRPTPQTQIAVSEPIAARATTPSAVPLTGFEEADTLNPAFGRTAPDGNSRGFTLGAGSTPIPQNTAAPYLDAPLEAPTSIATIPEPTVETPAPRIVPPTQAPAVDALQAEESGALFEEPDTDILPVEEVPVESMAVSDADDQAALQDEALDAIEPLAGDISGTGDSEAEVIPLAPAAVVTGTVAAPEPIETASDTPVEETPTEIVVVEEEVEVTTEVAEAIVPGISQPIIENEPPLIPPTDTNRIYLGRMQRTSKGFWGSKPPYDFELLNYAGDRIAYVDLSEIPTGSYDKFTEQIVQVYGTLQPFPDEDVLLIKAANVTLR